MLIRKAALLGLCMYWGLGLLQAQHCHISMRGQVTEGDEHEPAAYATIMIKEAGKMAVADEQGRYVILDLCENTPYTVEVSHIECSHYTQIVRLLENTTLDFKLVHDAVLKELVVVEKAVAPAPAQAQTAVDQVDLEAGKGLGLGETLKKLPGVAILATGSTIGKPIIQGLHSNRIAIVSNNVVLEGQQWGSEHAPEIDPFSAAKITVVKGAAGVRYGPGAMGGAVILEPAPLRKEAGLGGWLSLGGFSNGLGGVAAGAADWHLKGRSLAFRLQGTVKRSGNLRTPDYFLHNTGAAEWNLLGMTGWKKGRWEHESMVSSFNQQIAIMRAAHIGNLTDLQRAIDSDVPLNNQDVFSYDIDRPYQQIRHFTLKHKAIYRFNDVWRLSGQYVFQFNHRREYDVVRSSGTASTKPQLSFRLWTNSLDVALEHLPIRHWQGGVGVQVLQQTNFVGKGGLIPDYNATGASVWVMERRRRFPRPWEFEFGARYDFRRTQAETSGTLNNIDTLVQFSKVSGTVGAIYHFTPNLSATANTGFAWRPPHVNELFARGVHQGAGTFEQGNPNLKAEKAWNTNVSLQWRRGRSEATVSVFRNQIQDFIYLDPQNNFVLTVRGAYPAYFYAQADAVLKGLEASFVLPVSKQWSVESRLSMLRAQRILPDSEAVETGAQRDWLPLMPADRIQFGIKWAIRDKTKTDMAETFVRLMAGSLLKQTRIPTIGLLKAAPAGVTTFSLDAARTFFVFKKPLEIGLTAQNLLNARYRDYLNFFRYYADEPGVNVGIRAKLIF